MTDLPLVEADPAAATGDGVEGVVLAAGTGSRFGEDNKLLAELDREPLVRRAVRTLLEARLAGVTVVLGHEARRVRAALSGLDVRAVCAPDYAAGQSRSVRAGVRAVPAGADAALFALGDMPAVAPATVDALVAAYEAGAGTALAAAWRGRRGNPTLFDRQFFDALADVTGDVGGREILLSAAGGALVETGDPGVRRDVDRPADLDDLRDAAPDDAPDAAPDDAPPGSDRKRDGGS